MKKIEETRVRDILNKIGINLSDRDVQVILKNDTKAIDRFEEIKKTKRYGEKMNSKISFGLAVIDIFEEYEDKMNKEYLVLLTLYNVQKTLEEQGEKLTPEEIREARRYIKNAIELIGNRNFDIVDLNFDEKLHKIMNLRVINSIELIRCIQNKRKLSSMDKPSKKQAERIEEIHESIGLENLAQVLTVDDIKKVISISREVGQGIFEQISWNSIEMFKKAHPEIAVYELGKVGHLTKEFQRAVLNSKEYNEAVVDALMRNCKYIDIDKLLLLASYRIVSTIKENGAESIRISKNTEEGIERESKEETLIIIEDLVKGMYERTKKGTTIEAEENETDKKVEYSKEELKKDVMRFRGGRYISEEESKELRKRLLDNETNLMEADEDVLRTIDFEEGDAIKLLTNSEENIIYLINAGAIEKADMAGILKLRDKCSERLFAKIQEKGLLNYEQIIRLFQKGILGPENLAQIENEEEIEEIKKYARENVRKLYENISNREQTPTPEELKQVNRYSNLYKLLNITGKTEEEIKETSNELISSFEESISNEILERLYQYGLITLDSAADWGVDLTEMLAHNSIKPTDLKDLYHKQIITIEAIKDVIINGNLDYEEKLDLIYSTFDGESEEEYQIREELVDLLGISKGHKEETEKTGRTKSGENTAKVRTYITDPHARWKLISLLDKEYSKKFLPTGIEITDGHRVFLLPNQEKVVIEKMHEKRQGKKVSAYGSATYIMEADEFFKNIDNIIIEGKVNRTALREISEANQATKIIHSKSWGEAIKRYFEINEENERYTQEEIEEINTAIKNVEASRKERK